MKKIKVVTSNNRGFLLDLFNYNNGKYEFEYSDGSIYEVSNRLKSIISKIIKCRLFDFIGLFQVIKCKHGDENICFSYNRFLKSEKSYVVLVENPSALVNYCWNRPSSFVSKYKLKKLFSNTNLKAIICMSQVCYDGLFKIYDIPDTLNVKQIYPMIYDSKIDVNVIRKKCDAPELECLYISSDFYLKGGKDILNMLNLVDENFPIHITLISKKNMITEDDWRLIEHHKNLSFVEFNLSKDELNEYYKKAAILLNPTRGDSFSLVTLEAIKYGCIVIGSDVYAIREMVENGVNGFIQYPKYRYWSNDNIPNKKLLNLKQVRSYEDEEMTKMMTSKLLELNTDRERLYNMCMESFNKSQNNFFGEKDIVKQWEDIFEEC